MNESLHPLEDECPPAASGGDRPSGGFRREALRHAAPVTVLVLAPFLLTYPLGFHLSTHMFAPGDNFITLWTTAWQVHALQSPDDTFWNANIFHPYPRALALSVLRAVYIPFGWLILTLWDNPILMENGILLGSIMLSGLGMYWFCYRMTQNPLAALLAGLIFSCNPERFARIPHPHQINPVFWGPALFMLIRYLDTRRRGFAAGLVLCAFLQFITSIYLFAFLLIVLLVVFLTEWPRWKDHVREVGVTGLVSIAGLAGCVAPWATPYVINRIGYQFADGSGWLIDLSARPADFLMARHLNWLYGWTEKAFAVDRVNAAMIPPNFLFPGLVPVVLLIVAILWMRGVENDPARRLIRQGTALAAVGFLFAFGPWLHLGTQSTPIPMPAWLFYRFVPGFSVIRDPSRFSIVLSAGLALAAAGMVTMLHGRMPRWRNAAGWALVLLLGIECLNRPLPLQAIPHGHGIPKVEQWLAQRPERVVVSYPLRYNLAYMYFSIWHWKRLINGWTGYMPVNFFEDEQRLNTLPSPESLETLRRRGAELIVIYRRFETDPPFLSLQPEEEPGVRYYLGELQKRPDLFEPLYDDGAAAVFRFRENIENPVSPLGESQSEGLL